ncbi:unnamed protein product [Adineta ricciae]|uniref:PKD/REJ-like domain-containing protein n=1 Tax=Adineta ricciae TaxID=249248 RepID=A0A815WVH6_ADIRI
MTQRLTHRKQFRNNQQQKFKKLLPLPQLRVPRNPQPPLPQLAVPPNPQPLPQRRVPQNPQPSLPQLAVPQNPQPPLPQLAVPPNPQPLPQLAVPQNPQPPLPQLAVPQNPQPLPQRRVPQNPQPPLPQRRVPQNPQPSLPQLAVPPNPQPPPPRQPAVPPNPQPPLPQRRVPPNPQRPLPQLAVPPNPQPPLPQRRVPPNPQRPLPQLAVPQNPQPLLPQPRVPLNLRPRLRLLPPPLIYCFSPIITLIPSTSSLSLPLQYRRSQDFSISSSLQLNCSLSLSTTIKWIITNCTSTCSSSPIQLPQTLITTSSELFIPGKTLVYGTYQFTLSVTMAASSHLSSSASAYVKIVPSSITPNLIQFGTSMITRGYQQQLTLDPGLFSADPDALTFNATNWKYKYFCRIYNKYNFPNIGGNLLTIDDPQVDTVNPSCVSQRSGSTSKLNYTGPTSSRMSALTLLPSALTSNQTYQFMVQLKNRLNSSRQATGYLLVQTEDSQPELIAIS